MFSIAIVKEAEPLKAYVTAMLRSSVNVNVSTEIFYPLIGRLDLNMLLTWLFQLNFSMHRPNASANPN